MAYGLKLKNASGDVVLDENYRYNNNVMTGTVTMPVGVEGDTSPFIALSGADDPDRFLIFTVSIQIDGYEVVTGPNGFRFRRTVDGSAILNIDYFVMRVG